MRGLYVITDPTLLGEIGLINGVQAALAGGARMVQYRHKLADAATRLQEAQAILALCQAHHVPLIINDDVELAAHIGAAGVHLGEDDGNIAVARAQLGSQAIIGASCYNNLSRAMRYAKLADYIALGAFYPSPTKPHARRAEVALLAQLKAATRTPIVCIGGITADNAAPLVAAGADMLAVVSGVWAQPDITAAAQQLSALFE